MFEAHRIKKVKCSSWFYTNRNRSASLFIPVSSASDRADLHLQNYHKTYSQQQVFSQQQGTDSAHQTCVAVIGSYKPITMNSVCSMVFRGCVYGEGKVVQPVSEGGFEPASYFTNPAAAHSPGRTMCSKQNTCWMVEECQTPTVVHVMNFPILKNTPTSGHDWPAVQNWERRVWTALSCSIFYILNP